MNLVKQNDNLSFRYSILPSFILYEEPYKSQLLDKAKLIYSFIVDRLKLSIKNNFVNENGEVFVYFSRKEAEKLLCCTDRPITKAFNELLKLELIFEENRGIGKARKIYVNKNNLFLKSTNTIRL